SPGLGLALADAELWAFRKTLLEGLTSLRVDSVALGKAMVEFVEGAGKEGADQRRRARLGGRLLLPLLQDAPAMGVQGGPPRAGENDRGPLTRLVARADTDTLLAMITRCLEVDEQIARNLPLALVLEGLLDALGQRLAQSGR